MEIVTFLLRYLCFMVRDITLPIVTLYKKLFGDTVLTPCIVITKRVYQYTKEKGACSYETNSFFTVC